MADVSLSDLKKSIDALNALFSEAAESMKAEPAGAAECKCSEEVMKKLHELQHQNSEIAAGIVAVADMVRDLKKSIEMQKPEPAFVQRPMPRPMPQPMPQMPRQMPPPPMPPQGFAPQQPQRAPSPFPRESPTFRPFPPPTQQPSEEEFPQFGERAEAPFPGLLGEEAPRKKRMFGLFK